MSYKFNPFTSELDIVGSGTSSPGLIFDGLYSDSEVSAITYNLKDSAVADYDIIYNGGNSQ